MNRGISYGVWFALCLAAAVFSLCWRQRHDDVGCRSAVCGQSTSLPMTNCNYSVEYVKEAVGRLKVANMTDSAGISCEMLANLSNSEDVFVGKEDLIALLGIVEELESRQIVLSNGVSVAARDFARLGKDDFKPSVDALCALRLFCAKASARLDGVGDVGSELWLVHFLTRAKSQLASAGTAERQELIDSWLGSVWSFVDSRECNAYKATRKLWNDGLPHIRGCGSDDDYLKAFVDQVRKNFIDRIARMGDGHVVPWGNEFTVENLNSPASKGERAK